METVDNIIFNHPQPLHLLFVELDGAGLFFKHPLLEIFVHGFIIRGQGGVQSADFADERDNGGKFITRRTAALFQRLVGTPYMQRRQ